MFGKFSEQVKKSSKPVNSLVALNAKKLEALSQMQTEFFTGFMADSVKYVESITVQTEVKGVIAAQTSYAEALKERFAHASKDTYGAINDIREEYTDLLKTSLDENAANVPAAFQSAAAPTATKNPEAKAQAQSQPEKAPAVKTASAPAKKATAKKAATKPTSKPVAKPAVKSEAKPAVKASTKPAVKAADTAPSKTVAKPEAKPAVKAKASVKADTTKQ